MSLIGLHRDIGPNLTGLDVHGSAQAYRAHGWVGGSLSALRNFAEPLLERLAGETGESAFLSVMTPGFEVKYVAKAVSSHLVRYDAPLRGTREAYCSSSGLAIVAWLPTDEQEMFLATVRFERLTPATPTDPAMVRTLLGQARIAGYAELRDARVVGASGVSAPILDGRQRPIAALSLVAPSSRFDSARRLMRERVAEGARELSARITLPLRASDVKAA